MRHLNLTPPQLARLSAAPTPEEIERVLGHQCLSATLRGCHLTLHDAPRQPLALRVRATERPHTPSAPEQKRQDFTIRYSPKRRFHP